MPPNQAFYTCREKDATTAKTSKRCSNVAKFWNKKQLKIHCEDVLANSKKFHKENMFKIPETLMLVKTQEELKKSSTNFYHVTQIVL